MTTVPAAPSTGLSPRFAAALAYAGWWITGALFWALERHDPYVRFHAVQATVTFGVMALLIAGFCAMAGVSLPYLPTAFRMFLAAAAVTWLVAIVLWAYVMWCAATGKWTHLPVFGDWAQRLAARGQHV